MTALDRHAGSPARTIQCMEVWGGNDSVQAGVAMLGVDAWVLSRPWKNDSEGGDVHYLSACATGRIARALIADVSGHGQDVAAVSRSLRDLMRRYVNFMDQRKVARELNRQFVRVSESGHFATAVMATFWTPTNEVDITGAGHPAPLVYRARSRRWEPVVYTREGEADLPLGIMEGVSYGRTRVRLGSDDLLLMFTDGLIEAGVEHGRMLGERGAVELLMALDATRPETLLPELAARVRDAVGGVPNDDVTMLLLRPNAAKPRISVAGGLRSGWRVAGGVVRSLTRGGGPPLPQATVRNLAGAFVPRVNGRAEKDVAAGGA